MLFFLFPFLFYYLSIHFFMMNRNDGSEGAREGVKKTYRNTPFFGPVKVIGI